VSGCASTLFRNLIRRHPCRSQIINVGSETSLSPRSAARRTKGRQGGETAAQKVSQFSDSRMNRERASVCRMSPIYIEGPSPSQI
jgi:hypothetical protein